MNPESVDILRRLSNIRRVIRRRLGLYGLLAVASGGCLSILTVITIDWLLDLPPPLRVFGAVLFVLGFGVATLHWIVRPLQAKLSLAQVAGKLEQRFPWLNDRLTSAVGFLTDSPHAQTAALAAGRGTGADVSRALVRELVVSTNRAVAELPLHTILTRRPLMVQAAWLAIGLGALTAVTTMSHEWVWIGLTRFSRPFDAPDWPHAVHIEPLTADLKVPLGESTTVRMRVTRGCHPDLRGVVRLVDSYGQPAVLAMHYDGDREYRCTIDSVSTDMTYWFEAGDDDTRRDPLNIIAVRRPAATHVSARVQPPAYAAGAKAAEFDLTQGPGSAVPGSVAEVIVTSSKALRLTTDGTPAAWLQMRSERRDGQRERLSFVGEDSRTLMARIEIEEEEAFEVVLLDRDELSNRGGSTYRITARPDRPPVVDLIEPRSVIEATPRGSIRISARVEDDFGLSALRLNARAAGTDADVETALFGIAEVSSSPGGITASIDYDWNLSSMQLKAPTTVTYRIEAIDNCPCGPAGGSIGTSRTMRLKIISDRDFEAHVNEEFVLLQKRVRDALQAQQTIAGSTRVTAESKNGDELTRPQSDTLKELAHRQTGAARRLRELADRFTELARKLRANQVHDADAAQLVERAAATLSEASDGPTADAARLLEKAGEEDRWTSAGPLIQSASDQQRESAAALIELIRNLDGWGNFQSLVGKTRDLADRQETLRGDGERINRDTIGKRADELSRAQQAELQQLELRQRQIADEFNALIKRLGEAAKPDQAGDAASASAAQAAMRAAAAGEVADRMDRAAGAIGENRLAASGMEQQLASRGLSKMLAGLEQRESRRLAELAKKLERADRRVAVLLARQEALLTATREAVALKASRSAFDPLARDQAVLQRNADAYGQELSESVEAGEAGNLVRKAASEMSRAAELLGHADGEAPSAQTDAAELLRQALGILEEQARLAAHAASQRLMAAVRAELEELRDGQRTINDGTREVTAAKQTAGRLNREGARRASGLSTDQQKWIESLSTIRERMADTVVYDLMMSRAYQEMRSSKNALDERRLDEALASTQEQILRRFEQLIRALYEAAALPPSDDFVEADSDSSGDSASGDRPPIPTAAELLVLKTMQAEVLTETMELDAGRPPDDKASEQQLKAAAALGTRQKEIRELTEAVVKKAAGGR